MTRFIPAADWLKDYSRGNLINDALAAVIVTIMLIPQSLAYALLAGLPAEMGLYASICLSSLMRCLAAAAPYLWARSPSPLS